MKQQQDLTVGMQVDSFDHRQLGVVSAIEPDRIQIQPRFRSPYWIGDALVRSVEARRVTLHLTRGALGRYEQSGRPGYTGEKSLMMTAGRWFGVAIVATFALMAAALGL